MLLHKTNGAGRSASYSSVLVPHVFSQVIVTHCVLSLRDSFLYYFSIFLSALLGSNHFTVNLHQWLTKLIRIAQTHAHTFSPSSGLPKNTCTTYFHQCH
jgi:hypothetical protein